MVTLNADAPPEHPTPRDVPQLASRTTIGLAVAFVLAIPFAILTLLVRTESEGLERLDTTVADDLNRAVGNNPFVVDVLQMIGEISTPWVLRAIALVIAIILWRSNDRISAIWLVVTMTIGAILGWLLKLVVERARPEFDEPVAIASGYSFPSGHALNSMLFAACMMVLIHPRTHGRVRALAWTLAVLFVLVVGLDRIALGVHYVSDVIAGWAVALATVAATTFSFGITHRHRFVTENSGNPSGMPTPTVSHGSSSESPAPQDISDSPTWPRTLGHLAIRLIPGWIAIWAVIIGLGLLVTGPLADTWPLTSEDDLNQALEDARTPLWDSITFGWGWLGATAPVVLCAILAAIVLRFTLRRWAEAVFVLAAPLGQSVVFLFTQLFLERDRPDVERLDDSPPTSSFPSGHSSAAMALWWSLALICHRQMRPGWRRNVVVIVLALLPLGVIAARLYRGMHHPSDVAASLVNASLIILLTDHVVRGTRFPAVCYR